MSSQLAQVTEKECDAHIIKSVNKRIRYLRSTAKMGLVYHKLDHTSLKMEVYADASFANKKDQTTQVVHLVVLTDASNKCNIMHYASYKSRRVVRSVLGGELYAYADAFDYAYTLNQDLKDIMKKDIPISMFTDSKSLFDVITKASYTAEKSLMIDITAVRNAYNPEEISDGALLKGPLNPAEAFTKAKSNGSLLAILKSGKCEHETEQWVTKDWKK